ncbi:MAG: N-acetylmuramic acid 6-phosphate etherase [Spirochaetia bacterium]|nr:N-acetylmuramic acid 6-phosphate etherase [Spirochaetia bacterium]
MLDVFTTEQRNEHSFHIDEMSTHQILEVINNEDKSVPYAVEKQLDTITALVDDVVISFKKGGRLFYIGAGTSGRLGVLDASECPPTFGVSPHMVVGIIAGGEKALTRSIENAEDDEQAGIIALNERNFSSDDVLIGITASGGAPYVLGAMHYAKQLGAVVGAISCNKGSRTFLYANHCIFLDVGPEVVTGSTRMKSGTAQKLVLNMITTTSMIRIGKVYHNLMVDLTPVNKKLVERSKRLIRQATGCTLKEAEEAFEKADRKPKIAILMVLLGIDKEDALLLEQTHKSPISQILRLYKEENNKRNDS